MAKDGQLMRAIKENRLKHNRQGGKGQVRVYRYIYCRADGNRCAGSVGSGNGNAGKKTGSEMTKDYLF